MPLSVMTATSVGMPSFPTAAKVSDLRPYTKGTLVREEADLEDDLEFDDEPESFDDIGSVLPPETHAEEGFQIDLFGEIEESHGFDKLTNFKELLAAKIFWDLNA